jgi:hypothetical protein
MSSPIKIFTLRLFLLVVSLSLLIYVLKNYLAPEWVHHDIWILFIFFSVFTLLSGLFVLYLLKLSEENTTNILLGTSVLRLLVSAGFFAIMMFLGISDQTLFVINFFIVYLFYLLFDILTLITNLRPNLK